jgi:hypothetical protein
LGGSPGGISCGEPLGDPLAGVPCRSPLGESSGGPLGESSGGVLWGTPLGASSGGIHGGVRRGSPSFLALAGALFELMATATSGGGRGGGTVVLQAGRQTGLWAQRGLSCSYLPGCLVGLLHMAASRKVPPFFAGFQKCDFIRIWGFSKGPKNRSLVYRFSFGGWGENKRQNSSFLVALNLPGGESWFEGT